MASEKLEYGLTGNPEKDGYLTIEQQRELESIQDRTATSLLDALAQRTDELWPMAAMATGIGKGRIIHKVISETKRQNPKARILVIAGTKQSLVQQTHESLASHQERDLENSNDTENHYIDSEDDDELVTETLEVGDDIFTEQTLLYTTGAYGEEGVDVEATTIQKIQSENTRGKLDPTKYDLVIVDEVHNIGTAKRKATISQFKSVVGFTATAYRHTGNMKTPEEYGFKIVESLPLPDAQEMGFLPPLIGMQLDTTSLVDEIPTTYAGKINYTALEKILKNSPELRPYIAERLSHILRTENGVYKTVVAVNYVWEAKEIALLMKQYGFRVGIAVNQQATKEHHTDEVPAVDAIRRYKLPSSDPESIDILISPYVASEGFDAPATEVVVWASPTDSPVRYTQYTGRLARRAPGKRYGVVVDCLYQTQQYNYSYNMAMWMKGSVRQLDNGLLYLGPERNIEELGELVGHTHFATENRRKKEPSSLSDLISEPLLPIQPGETPINSDYLDNIFLNGGRLSNLSQETLKILGEYYPELHPIRKHGVHKVSVFTDPTKFIEVMVDLGAKTKNYLLRLQEGERPISQIYLKNTFINHAYLQPLINKTLELMTEKYPTIYFKRILPTGKEFYATTDPTLFVNEMVNQGARLKNMILPLQPTEKPINVTYLNNTFINGKRLWHLVEQAFQILDKDNPDLYPIRKHGVHIVRAFTDPNRFIEVMTDLGAKPQECLALQQGEIVIDSQYIVNTFYGSYRQLGPLANQAKEIVLHNYPDLYPIRISGSNRVVASINPKEFIETMLSLGATLRTLNPE